MQQQRLKKPKLLTVTLALLIVLALHYSKIAQPVESLIVRAVQPLSAFFYNTVTRESGQGNLGEMTKEELLDYIQELEEELNGALADKGYLQTLVDESGLVREQQDFLQERSFQAITAKVAGRSTDNLTHSLVVNRGENDGVEPGLAVIVGNGVLVGTVDSVEPYSSKVLLTTSFNSLVSGVIQSQDQSPGMVSGEHNLSLLMEFIPQLDNVTVGELVQTSGAEEGIPHGLILGQIQEVRTEPGSLFQEASLRPLYDSSSLVVVSILLP